MKNMLFLAGLVLSPSVFAAPLCTHFGPQSPRDISEKNGTNPVVFAPAPAAESLNLCNIHTHTNAEHKGPGFSIKVNKAQYGGYQCNETAELSAEELKPLAHPHFEHIAPGDTIEVHWVYSSCNVAPGESLAACLSEQCRNPELRVESQVFLLVNDKNAANFADFTYAGHANKAGLHQPKALPPGTPVVYTGSTTGSKYNDSHCSPYQVTWSVRPQCMKLDINSLNDWGEHNPFNEHHSHGIRPLVVPEILLSPIPE